MGSAKRELEEAEARGWSAPSAYVCPDCLEDAFLKTLIQAEASDCECDYCGKLTREPSAAPVESIMPAVASALYYFYAEPTSAGVPYDEGWVLETTDTADALMGVPLNCDDDLFDDVARAFFNTEWVAAAEGDWASAHRNKEWSWAWQSFSEIVKHRSRHFFRLTGRELERPFAQSPLDVLQLVSEHIIRLGLIANLQSATKIYRVRERVGHADWPICADELGAPPNDIANAGRMNPAGISYFYASMSQTGALAEVLRGPPCQAAIATFQLINGLTVVDLTRLPPLPSVFDEVNRGMREAILFLDDFVRDICKPVQKNGSEYINYVPSQVVSEYFAQVFETSAGQTLDGIMYPSAVAPGSVNLALFPRESHAPFAHAVKFVCGDEISLNNWTDFSKEVF